MNGHARRFAVEYHDAFNCGEVDGMTALPEARGRNCDLGGGACIEVRPARIGPAAGCYNLGDRLRRVGSG